MSVDLSDSFFFFLVAAKTKFRTARDMPVTSCRKKTKKEKGNERKKTVEKDMQNVAVVMLY